MTIGQKARQKHHSNMHIPNRTSRYHLIKQLNWLAPTQNPRVAARCGNIYYYKYILQEQRFIQENSADQVNLLSRSNTKS